MLTKKEYFLLNFYHIIIDGLCDSVPIILTFIALYFGGGEKEVGIIVSFTILISTFMGLGTIYFSRYVSLLQATSVILCLYGIGYVLCSFSVNLVMTTVCFAIAILGHSVFHNMSFSYLTANTKRATLGKTMSDFVAVGDLGRVPLITFAGFAAAFVFLDIPGWRLVCFAYGVLAILCALGLFWYAFAKKNTKALEVEQLVSDRKLPNLQVLKKAQVALSIVASALNALSCDRIFTFLPLLLISKGIAPEIIGGFAFGFTIGCFIGKIACGRMIDKIGTKNVFIIAKTALIILLGVLVSDISLPVIIAVSFCIGIVTKGSSPVVHTIITEYVHDAKLYSDIFSLNSFARGIINILSPLAFGTIAHMYGISFIYVIMMVGAAFSIIPICLIIYWDKKQVV